VGQLRLAIVVGSGNEQIRGTEENEPLGGRLHRRDDALHWEMTHHDGVPFGILQRGGGVGRASRTPLGTEQRGGDASTQY
jgi:hypothetical protein